MLLVLTPTTFVLSIIGCFMVASSIICLLLMVAFFLSCHPVFHVPCSDLASKWELHCIPLQITHCKKTCHWYIHDQLLQCFWNCQQSHCCHSRWKQTYHTHASMLLLPETIFDHITAVAHQSPTWSQCSWCSYHCHQANIFGHNAVPMIDTNSHQHHCNTVGVLTHTTKSYADGQHATGTPMTTTNIITTTFMTFCGTVLHIANCLTFVIAIGSLMTMTRTSCSTVSLTIANSPKLSCNCHDMTGWILFWANYQSCVCCHCDW